jgi:hypothetical protein
VQSARTPLVASIAHVALVAGLLVFLAAAAWFPIRNPDIWFHLAAGRWMLEHGEVIRADPFSFTAAGAPWIAHEWGFEVAAAYLQRLGGENLLLGVKVVLVLLIVPALLAACRFAEADALVGGVLLGLWTLMSAVYLYTRPQVVTYFLLAVLMAVLLRWKYHGSRAVWALPPLFLLWANLHAGFLGGLLVLGIVVAGEGLLSWRPLLRREPSHSAGRGEVPRLAGIAAACVAATLVTPFGWRLYLLPGQITGSAYLQSAVTEWLPSWDARLLDDWDTRIFWGMLALALLAMVHRFGRTDLTHLALVGVFGLLAARSNRHIPVFGVVALPLVARNLTAAARRFLPPRAFTGPARAVACLVLAASLAGVAAWSARSGFPITRRASFAGGVDHAQVPVDAVDWMEAHHVDGRAFNSYIFGGYLAWRQWPRTTVSMDGRNEVYGEALVREHYDAQVDPAVFAAFDARHAPELVLLDARRRDLDQPLFEHLLGSEEWSLVYSDRLTNLFVRRIPRFEALAAEGW